MPGFFLLQKCWKISGDKLKAWTNNLHHWKAGSVAVILSLRVRVQHKQKVVQKIWSTYVRNTGRQRGYEALQDTVYILLPPRCKNYCTTSCICWTPTLRLKMTTTDPAFRWCRLLVLVVGFSQRKCGVCPKKVGKTAFLGAVNSSELSSHESYSLNWKGIDQKLGCSEMLGPMAFRWLS